MIGRSARSIECENERTPWWKTMYNNWSELNVLITVSEILWFVRDTCQMMSVNIMSRARGTVCCGFLDINQYAWSTQAWMTF